MTGTGPQKKLQQEGNPPRWWKTLFTDPLLLFGTIILIALVVVFLREAFHG